MTIYRIILITLILTGFQTFALAENSNQAREIAKIKAAAFDADVYFGVDVYGRISAAIDTNEDGLVDQTFRFTASTRIPEAFEFRLYGGHVSIDDEVFAIRTADRSFLLWLAMADSGREPPVNAHIYDEVFLNLSGIELAVQAFTSQNAVFYIDNLDVNDIATWPESFERDLLGGGTVTVCNTCATGGPGAPNCSISGCGGHPDSCEVNCSGAFHACCGCAAGYPPTPAVCACCGDEP